jgi:hypothetical protein
MADDKPTTIIEQAKKRFKACVEAEREQRAKELDDLEFLDGEPEAQWGAKAHRERVMSGRPAHVVNRLEAFVQHVANSQRQNRVSAKVFPVDDGGDEDTADVIQGLLRHIEYSSKADIAYDTAEFFAVAMGRGYWRIVAEYCDPMSFDQELRVVRISNPFQVFLGPHELPDGSDAKYGFIITWYTEDEYEAEHGNSEEGAKDWDGLEEDKSDWAQDDRRAVVEYYCIETKKDTLVKLQDGKAALKSEMPPDAKPLMKDGEPVERETTIPTVKFYKMNALRVMDQTVFPGEYIPIPKVVGSEMNINGKQIFKGLVRNMKDAQRQYNFMVTAQTEAIAMDRGQVVLTEGQVAGHESEWKNMVKRDVLTVKDKGVDGKPLPVPTRLQMNASITAKTEARQMAGDDLKALTSIYDASLGAKSNETSGRGIAARQQQSDIANFHFQDNLTRSITHGTRILVGAIGTYYDTPRVVRIIGDDDTHKVVKVNQELQDGQKSYNLNVGKYDVVCTAGPNFQTRKQESADKLTALVSAAPGLMNVIPDYIMKAQDIPYANEMAERLKKTLPPNLQDDDPDSEIPPQVKAQMDQLTQQNEELTNALHGASMALESKQGELQSKEKIAAMQAETQLAVAELNSKSKADLATLQAELDSINAKYEAMWGIIGSQHQAGLQQAGADQDTVRQAALAEHGAGLQADQNQQQSDLAMQQAEHAQSIAPTESEGAE